MATKIPKGKLLIIGGAEDKGDGEGEAENRDFEILGELLPKSNKGKHEIEIITTASKVPQEVGKKYINAFSRAGFHHVHGLDIRNKEDARNEAYLDRLRKAHAVFFSGGDQFRLATILGGTPVVDVLYERYLSDEQFILAGTSAGAMAIPTLMLYQGEQHEAMRKGDVKTSSGLGFMDQCIIDTHFVQRGRFGRLVQAVLMNPTCLGIGLGEDTALLIHKGNEAQCRGSGMVILVDAKDIGYTNISQAEEDDPLCVENLRVHILVKGNSVLLGERRFMPLSQKSTN